MGLFLSFLQFDPEFLQHGQSEYHVYEHLRFIYKIGIDKPASPLLESYLFSEKITKEKTEEITQIQSDGRLLYCNIDDSKESKYHIQQKKKIHKTRTKNNDLKYHKITEFMNQL